MLLSACAGWQVRQSSEADLSEFSDYVNALDSQLIGESLRHLSSTDTMLTASDVYVRTYYSNGGDCLWFTRMGMNPEADTVVATLGRMAVRAGFAQRAFGVAALKEDLQRVRALQFDTLDNSINYVLARLEYRLTKGWMRCVIGLRHGFISPALFFNRLEMKEPDEKGRPQGYARLFDYDLPEPDYDAALEQLGNGRALDYLLASEPLAPLYQRMADMLPASKGAYRQKLLANMERLRWQLPQPEQDKPYIFANLAAQRLWAVSPDTVIAMRICYGASRTKTPLLTSRITHFEVNPEWVIPTTIVKKEVAPHGGDSAWFARHRYHIAERESKAELPAQEVTADMLRTGRYKVWQEGGKGNSLGRIVFRFPNHFSIYLHDTNNRGAFQYQNRSLSHGCVRVEKPFELASFLMPDADEWLLDRLRISMDIPPKGMRGRQWLRDHDDDEERPFRLLNWQGVEPRVPVLIGYYTLWPDPATGTLEEWDDGYQYDKRMLERIKPLLP